MPDYYTISTGTRIHYSQREQSLKEIYGPKTGGMLWAHPDRQDILDATSRILDLKLPQQVAAYAFQGVAKTFLDRDPGHVPYQDLYARWQQLEEMATTAKASFRGALIAAKHQGGTYEDLAKTLGLSTRQIYQHLRFGLANTNRPRGPLTKGTPTSL